MFDKSLPVATMLVIAWNASAQAPTPWHQLYIPGDGYWRARVPIAVTNESAGDLLGEPVSVTIGPGKGQADLTGRAEAVRVCNAAGDEYLFNLTAADGTPATEGPLRPGTQLTFPVECKKGETVTYYAYCENASAWLVPEFLRVALGVVNGGVEQGDTSPTGWRFDQGDVQHRVLWVTESPHSGKRCLKTEVAAGAEPTWIAARQGGIHITGGARYVLRGWVRAENVKGSAGWYLHVGNEQNSMILGPVINAGEGTYDWREVRHEFTAPAEANRAEVGTVLRGTGTAWHDDVVLERLDKPGLRVIVGAREPLGLQEVGVDVPWADKNASVRVPIRVFNGSDQARRDTLIRVPAERLAARFRSLFADENMRIVDPLAGGPEATRPHMLDGKGVIFLGNVEPRQIKSFQLYLAGNGKGSPTSGLSYADLVVSPSNLAPNPSFELGGATPDSWLASSEGQPKLTARAERVTGGPVGKYCVRVEVPQDAPLSWVGWRVEVPCEPSTEYWYACYVRTEDVSDGTVTLHAHFHKDRGVMSDLRQYYSTSGSLSGTSDWRLVSDILQTPADCRFLALHLTMRAHGTVYHDGVVLCRVTSATAGPIESLAEPAGGGLAAWTVNPLMKVFPDTPPERGAEARVSAARGERECLQLAVRSDKPVRNLSLRVNPPTHPGGQKLGDFTVHHVGYVPVDHPTAYYRTELPDYRRRFPTTPGRSDGWAGMWPDPLLPMDKFDLPANETHAFWIIFSVPRGIPAGDYSGSVEISGEGLPARPLPVRFTVWDFDIPDESRLRVIYDLRQGRGIPFLGGPDQEKRLRQFYKLMAERRVCTHQIMPSPTIRYENGRATVEAEEFDRMAAYCLDELKMNVFYTPPEFYCFGWGHPPKKFKGFEPFTPEYVQAYQTCLRAFWEHLRQRGWEKKAVLYISDEPHYNVAGIKEQMQKLCQMIREAVPEIPIYSSTWRHVPEWNGYLSLWGVGQYGCFPVEEMAARRAAGEDLWFTTDGQMCIDTPYLATERLLPWYCFKYDVSGYEFWGISWWTFDPFRFGWHSYNPQSPEPGQTVTVRYPNGDGYLTYPGWLIGYDGPLSSIRLEQAREGIEDYEYLMLLKELLARKQTVARDIQFASQALEHARAVVSIPNAGGLRSTEIMSDPDEVLGVRDEVARAIVQLQGM